MLMSLTAGAAKAAAVSTWVDRLTVPAWVRGIPVLFVFGLGFAVRMVGLTQPPLDFHATRQLHSAEIARGMYYQDLPSAPAWQRDFAVTGQLRRGVIEPQVMESLAAWSFGLLGGEELWVPRVLSSAFWVVGALFVYLTIRRWAGRVGGVAGAGFMLFAWYPVQASRAFMPDPLMVCLMAGTLWAGVGWASARRSDAHAWGWAVATGLLAGSAVFVKPMAIYMLGLFLALLVLGALGWRVVRSAQVWLMACLALAPLTAYVVSAHLAGHDPLGLGSRFFPELWGQPEFYLDWATMVDTVLGSGWLAAGVIGLLVIPLRPALLGVVGWWLGYVALGFTVSHHMSTHDYYSLPLTPVVALGIGALMGVAWRALPRSGRVLRALTALTVMVAILVAAAGAAVRLSADNGYGPQVTRWRLLGTLFAPTDQIVGLNHYYGHLFTYYGWRSYTWWPTTFDRALMPETNDFPSYWVTRTAGMDYFLLTDFGQWDAQPDVREHVLQHCTVVSRTNWYVIFDLRDSAECQHPTERP